MNKYGAKKTTLPDGQRFDSHREAHRYCELRMLEKAKRIEDIKRQVKYVLIPAQRDKTGKLLEREVAYIADFVYYDLGLGQEVVEDCKGFRTTDYKIKRKLMLWVHGIRIVET